MATSIFTGEVPSVLAGNDATPYTLGTAFSRSTSGVITHGRWFFPTTLPTGTTDFVLYAGTGGASIARASFVAPVAGAWNTIALPVSLAYAAGTTLVAAVRTSGMYVATASFFAVDLVNGDITAPAAGNGRIDAADQYPANGSGNKACFFADVVFQSTAQVVTRVARSSTTVTAGRTSSSAVAAGRTSSPSVSAARTSASTVSGG